jgi:predicted phosphodiesterase
MVDVENIVDDVVKNPDEIKVLDENETEICVNKIIPILKKEPTLIELSDKVAFVGDTHGDFETTKSIIKRFIDLDHIVFLGDYIDRAPSPWGSIFNLTYLLLLKYRFPEKIVLLKGNHECNYIIPCFPYEFESEIIKRFGSSKLHEKFVEVFSAMPLMVLSNNVFAAHGGIVKDADLNFLKNIGKNDKTAIEALVWSDPVVSQTYRGAGFPFSCDDLTNFLEEIHAKVFVRGHDYNTLGFSIYKDKCLTVFSSSMYKEMGNTGILVAIADKKVKLASDLIVEDFSTGKWRKYKVVKK